MIRRHVSSGSALFAYVTVLLANEFNRYEGGRSVALFKANKTSLDTVSGLGYDEY